MKILDVGCGVDGRSFSDHVKITHHITGIDLFDKSDIFNKHPNFTYIKKNANNLKAFKDKSMDLVISIGMLEHITSNKEYIKICNEIKRVGKQYIVVVPYKYAWIEPHYGIPFFGCMPLFFQILLIKIFNLSNHRNNINYFLDNFIWRSNKEYLKDFENSKIKLLPTLEMIAIFKKSSSP